MSFEDVFGTTAGFPKPGQRRHLTDRDSVPTLTIIYHPDFRRIGERAVLHDLMNGRAVDLSREQPRFEARSGREERPLADPYISREPLSLTPTADGGVCLDLGQSRTPVRVAGNPVNDLVDLSELALDEGVVIELSERVVLLLHHFLAPRVDDDDRLGLVGESQTMARVRSEIRRIADLDVPVLIRGETGTGKELVARAIHNHGPRARAAFVGVNMGAVQASLAGAELFGALKGSYTGSVGERKGYFRAAHKGSLFLDEIGETPTDVQVMLLRTLETGEVLPVGSQQAVSVDVRLIAATDADLEEHVTRGSFRGPLLHRLSSYEIWLPPLRKRRDDIGRLIRHFLLRELDRVEEGHRLELRNPLDQPWLPADMMAAFARHPWPGNVRQLQNAIRQLVIDNRGYRELQVGVKLQRLLDEAKGKPTLTSRVGDAGGEKAIEPEYEPPAQKPKRRGRRRKPADVGEEELLAALRKNRWELQATADQLAISRPSLYLLIKACDEARLAGDLSPEDIQAGFDACHGDLDAMVDRLEVSRNALRRRIKELGLVT